MQCQSTKQTKSIGSPNEISRMARKSPTELGVSYFKLLHNHNNPVHYDTEFGKSILFAKRS